MTDYKINGKELEGMMEFFFALNEPVIPWSTSTTDFGCPSRKLVIPNYSFSLFSIHHE